MVGWRREDLPSGIPSGPTLRWGAVDAYRRLDDRPMGFSWGRGMSLPNRDKGSVASILAFIRGVHSRPKRETEWSLLHDLRPVIGFVEKARKDMAEALGICVLRS